MIRFAPWSGGAGYGVPHRRPMPRPMGHSLFGFYRDPRRSWLEHDWLAFLFSPSYRADPDPF